MAPTAAASVPAEPVLVAVDLFGTRQISTEQLLATHGAEVRAFGEGLMNGSPEIDTEALLSKLFALGDFADVSPALVGYYEPGGMKYYLTFDFVDRVDAARRMPFSPEPTGQYSDPARILAAWGAYETKLFELQGSGAMSPRRMACPAFHCLGDPAHPELAPLSRTLTERVPAHTASLVTILRDDRDGRHRAAAAFALAYVEDGAALVRWLVPALRDPNALVRNNVMRVISDLACYHPEIAVPVSPIMEALDYPSTSDRNKAAAVLACLMERADETERRLVAVRAGAILVAMLRLRQPNNHDFAYRILKTISGRDFGEHDAAAWTAWLDALKRP